MEMHLGLRRKVARRLGFEIEEPINEAEALKESLNNLAEKVTKT